MDEQRGTHPNIEWEESAWFRGRTAMRAAAGSTHSAVESYAAIFPNILTHSLNQSINKSANDWRTGANTTNHGSHARSRRPTRMLDELANAERQPGVPRSLWTNSAFKHYHRCVHGTVPRSNMLPPARQIFQRFEISMRLPLVAVVLGGGQCEAMIAPNRWAGRHVQLQRGWACCCELSGNGISKCGEGEGWIPWLGPRDDALGSLPFFPLGSFLSPPSSLPVNLSSLVTSPFRWSISSPRSFFPVSRLPCCSHLVSRTGNSS